MNYDWNFARLMPYAHAFWIGTLTTVELTLLIVVFGTVAGTILGYVVSRGPSRLIGYVFIDPIRAIPPLVLLLFAYFLLVPQVIGVAIPAFWVAVIALSINLAAFTADVVRSAIESVPKPEKDAGRALGMAEKDIRRYIVLPHVFRQAIPAMTLLYIGMLKATSLAAVINVREVVYAAQTVIADISRSLEAWTVVALVYMILVIPATYAARRIEGWAVRGRQPSLSA